VLNLAILISGRGSNMESILSAVLANKITNVKPCVVISNNPDASGLKVASEKFEIPVEVAKGNGAFLHYCASMVSQQKPVWFV